MMLPELFPKQADGWQQQLGTGPYMVTDYVAGSSMTWARNPNYWQTNPVGPGKGDQLPYLDGVTSTSYLTWPQRKRLSAQARSTLSKASHRKTGSANLVNTMPYKPQYVQTYGDNPLPQGREDKANLPFKDVRVRQAMNYAVDKQKSFLKTTIRVMETCWDGLSTTPPHSQAYTLRLIRCPRTSRHLKKAATWPRRNSC